MRCTQCGHEVGDNSPAGIALKITASHVISWDYIEDTREDRSFDLPGFGTATMVARSLPHGEEQGDDQREAYLIFELNGSLYRKDGYADSYGERSWYGSVKPVTVKEKLVKAYVYLGEDE